MRDWWSARRTKEDVSGGVWRGSIFVLLVAFGACLGVVCLVDGGSVGGGLIFLPGSFGGD